MARSFNHLLAHKRKKVLIAQFECVTDKEIGKIRGTVRSKTCSAVRQSTASLKCGRLKLVRD